MGKQSFFNTEDFLSFLCLGTTSGCPFLAVVEKPQHSSCVYTNGTECSHRDPKWPLLPAAAFGQGSFRKEGSIIWQQKSVHLG